MERIFNSDIMNEIKERWSPRAFKAEKISDEDIYGILEATRYAPSCFNEQPWRFIIAKEQEELEKMQSVLVDSNKVWATKAPVLIMVLAKNNFEMTGKENYWHMFDAGTAWGYLSLEAEKRGLATHAMGGFKRKMAHELYNLPEDISVITVIAAGKLGDPESLPEELRLREEKANRKEIDKLILF